jgi:AcrR family transcriptional regulator
MSPRSVEANEQIKDERRNQILLSALKCFTQNGFSATKMSDIANAAGISYGLVYHYFKSKDEVYTELIEHAIDSLGRVVKEIQMVADDPMVQIRRIVTRVFDSVEDTESSGYYYVLMMNAITCEAGPVSAVDIKKRSLSRLMLFRNMIARGQELGQIRKSDPMELAVICFSTVLGLASLKVSGTIPKMPDPEILIRLF